MPRPPSALPLFSEAVSTRDAGFYVYLLLPHFYTYALLFSLNRLKETEVCRSSSILIRPPYYFGFISLPRHLPSIFYMLFPSETNSSDGSAVGCRFH